jgi:hypothetical protein
MQLGGPARRKAGLRVSSNGLQNEELSQEALADLPRNFAA